MNQSELQPGTSASTPTTSTTVKGKPAMAPAMMVQWTLEA